MSCTRIMSENHDESIHSQLARTLDHNTGAYSSEKIEFEAISIAVQGNELSRVVPPVGVQGKIACREYCPW